MQFKVPKLASSNATLQTIVKKYSEIQTFTVKDEPNIDATDSPDFKTSNILLAVSAFLLLTVIMCMVVVCIIRTTKDNSRLYELADDSEDEGDASQENIGMEVLEKVPLKPVDLPATKS